MHCLLLRCTHAVLWIRCILPSSRPHVGGPQEGSAGRRILDDEDEEDDDGIQHVGLHLDALCTLRLGRAPPHGGQLRADDARAAHAHLLDVLLPLDRLRV